MAARQPKVESRNERFADKASTRIWEEIPSKDNPYIAERCLCHGYDLQQLMERVGYVDMVYLLMCGELPNQGQRDLLERLMVGLCNPGPRHPATRAAMNAGVGKTYPPHVLPISLAIIGGKHLGGEEVEVSMRFVRSNIRNDAMKVAKGLIEKGGRPKEGDWHIAPGFGQRFGGVDIVPGRIAALISAAKGAGKALHWGALFASALIDEDMGWLFPGVAAAAFLDLGFHPRVGAGLFQLLCAPGLLAHGMELASRPITVMPFIHDEHYFIETTKN
jgi:citrate synthase